MEGGMSDHEAHGYEVVADCRVRAATDLFAHTWDPVVLAALRPRPHRRRELRDAIGGISDKVLTETLHRLLANGLVDRRAYAAAPPRVDYSLTDLGESLVDGPMMALGRWILQYGDELLEAQERAVRTAGDPMGSDDPRRTL
jgi:DNA-binding HxlR family transcriptional regulator